MQSRRDQMLLWGMIIGIVFLLAAPYIYASSVAGEGQFFSGFLLNPIDGNSYLAKMRQGWAGSWLFTLPYTAMPGEGVPLNLFYLFLGHLARWLGLGLITVFHLARLLGAAFMLLALYRFCGSLFEDARTRWFAFSLASVGSGLGWVAILFGALTSDFWVAEAFPFLAAYANAHFPLGLALQIFLLTPTRASKHFSTKRRALFIGAAALLSIVYPFGFALVASVLIAQLLFRLWQRIPVELDIERIILVAIGGGHYSLYQLWIVNTHPVLSVWNNQNLTPLPPLWDLMVALSPAILIAILGFIIAWRSRRSSTKVLLIWVLLSLALMALPFSLQRRMISGLFIPLSCLAALSLQTLTKNWRRWRWIIVFSIAFSIPTNLIVLFSGVQAARSLDEAIFIRRAEIAAFQWFSETASPDSLVMASPGSGLLLPAYSDVRVLYGHPFETVDAEEQRIVIESFYSESLDDLSKLETVQSLNLDYILYGPRERALGPLPDLPAWQVVFEEDNVLVLAPFQ